MSCFEIALAGPPDSAGLCRLFRETPMSGGIEVAMEREPDYFLGAALHSPRARVVVARDSSGAVVGSFSFAERAVYVDGAAREVALLSDLRVHPRNRRGTVLGRMFRFARAQGWLERGFAQAVIVRDNRAALSLFAAPRAGAPRFFPRGDYSSPAVYLRRPRPSLEGRYRVRKAGAEDLPAMQSLLGRESPSKQLYPRYRLADMAASPSSPYYLGLGPESYYLAFEDGELAGIAGVWDQAACKQTRIVGYHGAVRALRPLYNLLAPLTGRPGLPPAGSAPRSLCLHTVCTRGNDPEIFSVLARRIHNDFAGGPYAYFLCGFDARDPLLRVLQAYPRQDLGGKHFMLAYDEADLPSAGNGKLFYLEAARI
jgi:hypothetical protein